MTHMLPGWRLELRVLEHELHVRAPAREPAARASEPARATPASRGAGRTVPDPLDTRRAAATGPPGATTRVRRSRLAGVALALLLVLGAGLLAVSATSPPGWWGGPAAGRAQPAAGHPGSGTTTAAGPAGVEQVLVLRPMEGAVVTGSVVEVSGLAGRPLGRLHVDLDRGSTILATADLVVDSAGPFHVTLPIASQVRGPAQVRVSIAGDRASGIAAAGRSVWLCPSCA